MNDQQQTCLGDESADLVIHGGRVCLVEAGTFAERDVVVRGDRIATLTEHGARFVGDGTTVIDATDQYVVPGFIDAHTHVDAGVPFERYYHYALRGGTTAVVTESSLFGRYFPVEGPKALLAATADLPIHVAVALPPDPLYDLFEPRRIDDETEAALADLLARDRVVGVGELTWIHVVGRESPVAALCERARAEGGVVAAHGAGCSGAELAALATVADNDHEPIATDEVVERLENGLHAIVRYGPRDDIDALAGAYDRHGPAELSLATDGMRIGRIVEDGYTDLAVERAIEAGIEPADAVRMATLNPARHFGLSDRGSLAPGNYADAAILTDLEDVAVSTVLFEGDVVVRDGDPTVGPRPYEYPDECYDFPTVRPEPSAFRVLESAADDDGRVRCIEFAGGMLTTSTTVAPPIVDGNLTAIPADDVLKAAIVDRRRGTCDFVGFISGFGLGADAFATTSGIDVPGVLAVGGTERGMADAVERVTELGGGWAVVEDGAVTATLAQPLLGLVSEAPVEDLLERQRRTFRALDVDRSDARVGLTSLAFTGVPSLKLSVSGYADVKQRALVGLAPDHESVD